MATACERVREAPVISTMGGGGTRAQWFLCAIGVGAQWHDSDSRNTLIGHDSQWTPGILRAFVSRSRELDDREKLVDPPGRSHGCREVKDAWDLPAIRVTYKDHPDDLTKARFLQDRGAEICRAATATGSKCTWITCWSPAPSSATSNQRAGSD